MHDVRGGSPGVIGTPGIADAICLAGGSAYGLEAAQVILGHRTAAVTQVYAERDVKLAEKVMSEVG